jgi:effector-binding domain-containing protein
MKRLALLVLLLAVSSVFAQTAEKKETAAAFAAKVSIVGKIEVKTIPAMTAATVMEKATAFAPKEGYKEGMAGAEQAWTAMLPAGYETLGAWMKSGGTPTGPSFAIYYEDPEKTPAKDLTVKVGFPTVKGAKGTELVKVEDMPEQQAAVVKFTGPYEASMEIYVNLYKWIGENGYEVAGPLCEFYVKGPGDKVQPAEYLTEIHVPVKKAVEEKKDQKK